MAPSSKMPSRRDSIIVLLEEDLRHEETGGRQESLGSDRGCGTVMRTGRCGVDAGRCMVVVVVVVREEWAVVQ